MMLSRVPIRHRGSWAVAARIAMPVLFVVSCVSCGRNEGVGEVAQPTAEIVRRIATAEDVERWSLGIDVGTPLSIYPPTAEAARNDCTIEVRRDVLIGDTYPNPSGLLVRPMAPRLDGVGHLVIADTGDNAIKTYSVAGEYVGRVGRTGDGPGEYRNVGIVAALPAWIVMATRNRLQIWRSDGSYYDSAILDPGLFAFGGGFQMVSRPPTSIVVMQPVSEQESILRLVDVATGADRELRRVPSPRRTQVRIRPSSRTIFLPAVGIPIPSVATSLSGSIYITAGDRYQVLALDDEGETKWGLEVPQEPTPLSDDEIDHALGSLSAGRRAEVGPFMGEVEWPTFRPALSAQPGGPALRVDGHGHLYVFPYFADAPWDPTIAVSKKRPVDVYDSNGSLLCAGLIDHIPGWLTGGQRDYVFSVEVRNDSNPFLVRYALSEPFQNQQTSRQSPKPAR